MGRLETVIWRETLQEESMYWVPDVGTKTTFPVSAHQDTHMLRLTQEPRRQEDLAGASRGRCMVQLQGLLGC